MDLVHQFLMHVAQICHAVPRSVIFAQHAFDLPHSTDDLRIRGNERAAGLTGSSFLASSLRAAEAVHCVTGNSHFGTSLVETVGISCTSTTLTYGEILFYLYNEISFFTTIIKIPLETGCKKLVLLLFILHKVLTIKRYYDSIRRSFTPECEAYGRGEDINITVNYPFA